MQFVVGAADRVIAVREALEKIQTQGEIGTVNLSLCITYLKDVEQAMDARAEAIERFKSIVLGLD